ncbi:hypothetical protein HYH02_002816 [Chlamydomonas schloesseri]|uniref:Rab-GAP TBC domain-containing protein n=1 Tax=Chlamydomonas schloesseri TaxID=2026947 RepID=A0A835WR66_9CHLO|nr:hypothetical protein HYH02_002816 [Chlamydomonas schloesseri]|eukprot:KAG2452579.1 hypothetical protein HYH02_002816 [Chlamydomonas schloesseri]
MVGTEEKASEGKPVGKLQTLLKSTSTRFTGRLGIRKQSEDGPDLPFARVSEEGMAGRGDGAVEDAAVTGAGAAPGGGAAGAATDGAFDGNGSLGAGGLTREQLAAAVAAAAAGGGGGGALMHQAPIPEHRVRKFHKLLGEPVVDLDALRELSWSGVPLTLRPQVWRLLSGYLPPAKSRQAHTLARRRREYADMVPEYYDIPHEERSEDEVAAYRQVAVDVPRTAPNVPFFHEPIIQESLQRLLYIWGIRHPASGYVQGMNDLVTPFLAVYLSEHLPGPMEGWSAAALDESIMLEVEADCYWCLCKLIEGIQDHYTYAQPGIQRAVFRIKELVRRCEAEVSDHLEAENVDFIQFALRWVNCLLVRELPFCLALRLWDTYLAEGTGFSEFLIYLSAAFLLSWRDRLTRLEFQDLILFLQRLPTADWAEAQLERVLSEAFILRSSYGDAQSHLRLG